MDTVRTELAAALSRLLEASTHVELAALRPEQREAFLLAREAAAKALVKNRARSGRAWTTAPELASFFERWRSLRAGLPSRN